MTASNQVAYQVDFAQLAVREVQRNSGHTFRVSLFLSLYLSSHPSAHSLAGLRFGNYFDSVQ